MRRRLWLAGILLTWMSHIATGASAETDSPAVKPPALEKKIWCHYTAWHHPSNTDFAVDKYYNFPWIRPTGREQDDYKAEIALAQASGIDGVFVDLVGAPQRSTAFVSHMQNLIKAAEGTSFCVGACLDGGYDDVDWQAAELEKILAASGDSPNYPQAGGKPVVFAYSCLGRKPAWWHALREKMRERKRELFLVANLGAGFKPATPDVAEAYAVEFDMLSSFGESGIRRQTVREIFDIFSSVARAKGRYWMPPVSPGYIGAWLNGRNDFYQPHNGLDQIWECWETIAPDVADWVHLTTWNDHDETPLLPTSFDFGSTSLLNRTWGDRWRGRAYRTERPEIVFAYHREELAGTVWRIEAVALPCKTEASVELSGELIGADDTVLMALPPRLLSLRNFDRTEWNVPTAALAQHPAVTPRVRLKVLGDANAPEPPRHLPALFPVCGWIQNQVTVRAPWSAFSDRRAALRVTQDGFTLTAETEIDAGEPLAHVTLWRNDRPIGEFTPPAPGGAAAESAEWNVWFNLLSPCAFQVRVENGTVAFADREFADDGDALVAGEASIRVAQGMPWNAAGVRFLANEKSTVFVTLPNQPERAISAADLLRGAVVAVGEPKPALAVQLADTDVGFLRRPVAAAAGAGAWTCRLLTRAAHVDDRFEVRAETVSGRVIFSRVIAPFCAGISPRAINVVETSINMETPSGATGMPGGREFLFVPPLRESRVTAVPVHPACFRAGRWTFERGEADDLGERPFRTAKGSGWKAGWACLQDGGHDGGRFLELDGQTKLDFRLRSYPLGACTIDFYLRPAAVPKQRETILARSGWSSAFNFYWRPDGRIEAIHDGGDRTPRQSLVADKALEPGRWSRVTLTFDETEAILYLDGVPAGTLAVTPGREYGNCTSYLGGSENGFRGGIDDVTILSWPLRLGEALPPAK